MVPKVVFILPGAHISGGSRIVFASADGLLERGHDVVILTPDGKRPNWCEVQTPFQRQEPWKDRIAPEDLVVFNWDYDIDYVLSVQGRKWYYVMHFRHPLEEIFLLPLDGFLSVSTYVQDHTRETYGIPSHLVRTAIDHAVFFPRQEVQRYPRRVMTMRWGGWKGWEDVERAMQIVQQEEPDVDFLPVSGLTTPQMVEAYSSSAIFVSASYYEGLGLPPLEAMACGAAVVVTDSKGNDVYAKDRDTCLVVPVRDPEAIAKAVLLLLRDDTLRQRVVANGFAMASQFRWAPTIDRIERVLGLAPEGPDPAWLGPGSPDGKRRAQLSPQELAAVVERLRRACAEKRSVSPRQRIRGWLSAVHTLTPLRRNDTVRPLPNELGSGDR